jgi:two-component system nitrogen regulation response regulator NtrX
VANEKILVVDDEPGVRSALEAILVDEGFRVECVGSGEDGLEAIRQDGYDAVLLDVWLPGIDGLETLTRIREQATDSEVVMISGHGTIDTAVRATKLGAFDFIEKPLSLEKTLLVLRNALRQRRLEQANQRLIAQLSRDTEIVGNSAAARKLRQQIEVAIESDAPVLICGRQGSGRENVARRIHTMGKRSEAAFVEVPCGALDARAFDVAVYGGETQQGRFDLARNGSLFLEDVYRLGSDSQRKLAAALSDRTREADAPRLLASVDPEPTNIDPELAQCLDVLRLQVPGLAQRREDVPLLAERFMRELSREYGRPPRRLAPDALAALKSYDWPGEIRELANLTERLLLFGEGDLVQVDELPEALGGARPPADDLYRRFGSLAEGCAAFERYYVARVVAEENGDTLAAAAVLGLDPSELERRLRS